MVQRYYKDAEYYKKKSDIVTSILIFHQIKVPIRKHGRMSGQIEILC